MAKPIMKLILDRDFAALAERANGRFGVRIDAGEAERLFGGIEGGYGVSRMWSKASNREIIVVEGMSDDCIVMKLKRRLEDAGYLKPGGRPPADADRGLTVELHVFFIALEETDEMLDRLGRDREIVEVKDSRGASVFRTINFPQPIDKTAARVAPH